MPAEQKKLSPWTAVAVLQSVVWFFALPEAVFRPLWPRIFGSFSPEISEVMMNLSSAVTVFLYSLVMLFVYYIHHPFFEQYKILDQKWPWLDERAEVRDAFWKLSWTSVKLATFNLLFFVPVLTLAKGYILRQLGIPPLDFDDPTWPSYTEMLRHNLVMTLIHELGFYSSHRLMHAYPSLYKYHKVHHQYKMNTVLASQHNHVIDHFLTIGTPAVVTTMIVRPHSFTQFQWIQWVMIANLDDHIGYSFPWSPVRWFPGANLTEQHEFHHVINMGCFASKLDIYDKWFHTDTQYLKWAKKRHNRSGMKQL